MKQSIFKSKRRRRQLLFYALIIALPLLQFCIFYIGVNINTIVMAFQRYDVMTNSYSWAGLDNFKQIFRDFGEKSYMWSAVKNSLIFFVVVMCTMFLATLFSFYIYKKRWLSGVFRVALFVPHIVASITFVVMFKYFTENAFPGIVEWLTGNRIHGLISDPATAKGTIMFFCVFIGFGTQTLMFTSAMSEISESITEAAQLDGCSRLGFFARMVLPLSGPG
ncbi:MAG: sugar ABC transporter permease, partial [Clostridia bacterium]|nr:sugar ABC transporter permease [Clostridia bacterium]